MVTKYVTVGGGYVMYGGAGELLMKQSPSGIDLNVAS